MSRFVIISISDDDVYIFDGDIDEIDLAEYGWEEAPEDIEIYDITNVTPFVLKEVTYAWKKKDK